jgi:4-amino-4-deoxy-L-arabinose transferase-like glycosyltransferase
LGLAAASIAFYGRDLHREPATSAESQLALRAASVAHSGASSRVFVSRVEGDVWFSPMLVHLSALADRISSPGTIPARFLAVGFGAVDVWLLYIVAGRLFKDGVVAGAAALALLLTPAHVQFSRTGAPEGIWPLPFILAWMLGLGALTEAPNPRSRWSLAIGLGALVGSAYIQPSAGLVVPVLGGATALMVRADGRWSLRDLVPSVIAVVLVAVPAVWLVATPEPGGVSFARWLMERADVRAGQVAAQMLNRFWTFFSPSHLFWTRDNPGHSGVFASAMAVPLALGAAMCLRRERLAIWRIPIAAGIMAGPLAMALYGAPPADSRALALLPFAAVLAGWGCRAAWTVWPSRFGVTALFAAMAFQVSRYIWPG